MSSPQPPTFEDEASLFSLAAEYLEAAEILARTPPVKLNVSLVTLYLLGHAAELHLKSLLHMHGVSIEDLSNMKKYGHNLRKLIEEARKRELLTSSSLPMVEGFSKLYTSKRTEYRKNIVTSLPSIESLLSELRLLHSQVFNHVARCESGA